MQLVGVFSEILRVFLLFPHEFSCFPSTGKFGAPNFRSAKFGAPTFEKAFDEKLSFVFPNFRKNFLESLIYPNARCAPLAGTGQRCACGCAARRWPALAGAALRAPLPAPALRAAAAALRAYKYAKEIACGVQTSLNKKKSPAAPFLASGARGAELDGLLPLLGAGPSSRAVRSTE